MVKPILSLQATYSTASPTGFVAAGIWTGMANEWRATFSLNAQLHGYYDYITINGSYDASHVEVGDWVAVDTGETVQITQIHSNSGLTLDVTVTDIGEYNVNKSASGIGFPSAGKGFVFKIDDENNPLIDPGLVSFLGPTEYINIFSRFKYTTSAPEVTDSGPATNWIHANNSIDFTIAPSAKTTNSIAIGNGAYVSGQNSIVIGNNIQLEQEDSIAIGTSGEVKFFINASGNVGIGTVEPNAKLDIRDDSNDNTFLQLTNLTTGSTESDGSIIGISAGTSDLRIANLENANLSLETGGFERINIDTNGYINFSHSSFNVDGDAEYKFALLKTEVTVSGQQVWLTLPDNTELSMPDNSAWIFDVEIVGKQQGGPDAAGYRYKGLMTRDAGASTVKFVNNPLEELLGESIGTFGWEGGVSADPSVGGLRIYAKVSAYTKPGPVNWLAMVKLTELNF